MTSVLPYGDDGTPAPSLREILSHVISALSKVSGPDSQGNYKALCPFHDDHNPSLGFHLEKGFQCFTCGEKGSIHKLSQQLGIESSTAASPTSRKQATHKTIYEYDGFQAVRSDFQDGSKKFHYRRLAPNGRDWIYNLKDVRRSLYCQPQVKAAKNIIIVEGEKCADALNLWIQDDGFCDDWVATTNPQGAGNWLDAYSQSLAGKHVIILPDNDDTGRSHAQRICRSLEGIAASLKVVDLPQLPPKGDIVDFIRMGGNPDDIFKLAKLAPEWQAPDEPVLISVNSGTSENARTVNARPEIFHGLGGKIVQTIEPHSETDPMALMASLLAAFGNIIGRNPHFLAEADVHHSNLFVAVIGRSSKSRKGTSWGHIQHIFRQIEPTWSGARAPSGLSSGEGLIWHVRDSITTIDKDGKEIVKDQGVDDKRLMVVEQEFAQVLQCARRDGNTLSALIRKVWDTGDVQTLSKNSPVVATNAHISIVAHCTEDELLRVLGASDVVNGFSNRFLWIYAQRSKKLPNGSKVPDSELAPLLLQLKNAVEFGSTVQQMGMDESANKLWCQTYDWLSSERRGIFDSVTSRSEPQVKRLSMLYALLDCSQTVRREHLIAALAFWQYAFDSARHIFGDSTGSKDADRILECLRDKENEGMTQTQISDLLNHPEKRRLESALSVLASANLIRREQKQQSKGRPTIYWFACAETEWSPSSNTPEITEITELNTTVEDDEMEVVL